MYHIIRRLQQANLNQRQQKAKRFSTKTRMNINNIINGISICSITSTTSSSPAIVPLRLPPTTISSFLQIQFRQLLHHPQHRLKGLVGCAIVVSRLHRGGVASSIGTLEQIPNNVTKLVAAFFVFFHSFFLIFLQANAIQTF